MLNQLRVVWLGQVFPVWVQKTVCIFVKASESLHHKIVTPGVKQQEQKRLICTLVTSIPQNHFVCSYYVCKVLYHLAIVHCSPFCMAALDSGVRGNWSGIIFPEGTIVSFDTVYQVKRLAAMSDTSLHLSLLLHSSLYLQLTWTHLGDAASSATRQRSSCLPSNVLAAQVPRGNILVAWQARPACSSLMLKGQT